MLREKLRYKLEQNFGFEKGYKIYSQIIELAYFVTQNIDKPGFAIDFYDKVYEIIEKAAL